jgi:hypothetical protein
MVLNMHYTLVSHLHQMLKDNFVFQTTSNLLLHLGHLGPQEKQFLIYGLFFKYTNELLLKSGSCSSRCPFLVVVMAIYEDTKDSCT